MKDYKNLKKNLGEFVSIYGDSAFDMETPFGMEMLRITRKQKFRFQPDLEHLEPKKLDPKGQKLLESIHNDFESLERIRTSQSFEWRFAFPEVLDNNGDFLGFDLVIGNPPYISAPSQLENTNLALQRQTISNLKNTKAYIKNGIYIYHL